MNSEKRKVIDRANQTANLYTNIKESKTRSRVYNNTQYAKNNKRVVVESVHLKTSGDSSKG